MRIDPDDPRLAELFRDRYVPMLRLAAIVTRSPALAEDLVNEAFVKLVQHWPKVSEYDSPEAWVRRVVIRDAVRARGRRRREREEVDVEAAVNGRTVSGGADGLATIEVHIDVLDLVRVLPARERAVVALHYLEDLSVDETSDVLGIAPGTVKAHLAHAREHLRIVASGDAEEAS